MDEHSETLIELNAKLERLLSGIESLGVNQERMCEDISKIKSFFDKPTLLMLDEIPQYLVKAKAIDSTFFDTTLIFLNELVSAVNSVDKSRLILTTTADQKLLKDTADKVKGLASLDAFDITASLKGAVSRGADPLVPVKEKDAYGVICKRLVKEIDEKERDKIIDAYFDYYQEKGLITEQNYKQKMKKVKNILKNILSKKL